MSSASSVNETLAGYLAGQVTAAQLSAVVAAEYYRDTGSGMRDALKPVIDIVEQAHPGVVQLASSTDRPGFVVTLADRPFPKRYEADLRSAVAGIVESHPAFPIPHPVQSNAKPGLLRRIVAAVRRLFSA